jgi:hypothetical protein
MNLIVSVPVIHPPTPWASHPNSLAVDYIHVALVAGSVISLSYDITAPMMGCKTALAMGMYMFSVALVVV